MNVLFFKNNIDYVKSHLKKYPDTVAFWYAEGLDSYSGIENTLRIDNIWVEKDILPQFKISYPNLAAVFELQTFSSNSLTHNNSGKICFFASNDTHVYLFKNILAKYPATQYDLYCRDTENAAGAAAKLDLNIAGNEVDCKRNRKQYAALVLGNDWGLKEQALVTYYTRDSINSFCLQESILDFNRKINRLRYCSMPVFQGLNSLLDIDLNKMICAVIGNPRFEDLQATPLPATKKVFVNVNFTYGLYEDAREAWLSDILECCAETRAEYALSQHPRDTADLSAFNVLKSGANIVHQEITNSRIVISRFSALILEAICLGRPAIYYNPHKEAMQYDFKADNKSLYYAENKAELSSILEQLLADSYVVDQQKSILGLHLGNTAGGKTSTYIYKLLEDARTFPKIKNVKLQAYVRMKKLILQSKLKKQPY
ncbi:glycosyltransferase family protein [Mucilaginibacter glaciei]|uniref:Uncharacterized protein n=1 Tax=Mucilaginibacter glaciei TaxID=2772109 RepID=A0A926NQS7_9SPHI|nr:hypothetical protein [Mucilaginibacter glaciei]MBD1393332.1 hypothetical protein [Mucilaginibacter glaciei]